MVPKPVPKRILLIDVPEMLPCRRRPASEVRVLCDAPPPDDPLLRDRLEPLPSRPVRSRPLTASLGTGAMWVLFDVPPLPPLDLLYGGRATDAIILAALGGGLFFAARHFWKRGTNRALVVLVPLILFGLAVLGLDCQAWSRGREWRNDERSRYEEEHPRPSASAPGSASGRPAAMPSGSAGSHAR